MKALYPLVGMKFHNSETLVRRMPSRAPVSLVREPANSHDPLAIQVYDAFGHLLGYIKSGPNHDLARKMDAKRENGVVPNWRGALIATSKWPQIEVDE